jgi:hypothetical protein
MEARRAVHGFVWLWRDSFRLALFAPKPARRPAVASAILSGRVAKWANERDQSCHSSGMQRFTLAWEVVLACLVWQHSARAPEKTGLGGERGDESAPTRRTVETPSAPRGARGDPNRA